jgi:hypothetical protein
VRRRHDGPSPVNRGKPGAKHHLIVDGSGIPLAYSNTAGNRRDVSQLWPLLDRIPRDPPPPTDITRYPAQIG